MKWYAYVTMTNVIIYVHMYHNFTGVLLIFVFLKWYSKVFKKND